MPRLKKTPAAKPEPTPEVTPTAVVDHEANAASQANQKEHLLALHKELTDLGITNISNLEVMISRL